MTCSPAEASRLEEDRLWNPLARLTCLRCDRTVAMSPEYEGCRHCGGAPLVVTYERPDAVTEGGRAIDALHTELLPIRADRLVGLGQGGTPLVPVQQPSGGRVLLKLEGQNPTGSHKDRFHAIASAVARDLGHGATVTSSTGNHGLACAAFSAAAGIRALVLLHPEAPRALAAQIASHGAHVAVVPDAVTATVSGLVDEGWAPATSADPALAGRGNPFGAEGYKAIAYETVQQLGRAPAAVAVPAASGDTFYGVWRGFRDLHDLLGLPMPRLLACQPAGAAPLALTERSRASRPCVVEEPESAALSARDPRSGWHATVALRSGGTVVEVTEDHLTQALRRLARAGHSVEPASALSFAGIERARAEGGIDPDGDAVAVITSSGANWAEHIERVLGPPRIQRSPDALRRDLADADLVPAVRA